MRTNVLAFNRPGFDGLLGKMQIDATRFAERIGVGKSTVALVRRGWIPGDELKSRVAAALGVTIDYLWPRVEVAA